jgi:hypothetical protein
MIAIVTNGDFSANDWVIDKIINHLPELINHR